MTQACPTGAMCVKGHCMTGDEVLKEIGKIKYFINTVMAG